MAFNIIATILSLQLAHHLIEIFDFLASCTSGEGSFSRTKPEASG